MKQELRVGTCTLTLVEPEERMPYYEGISGSLKLIVAKMPSERWIGSIACYRKDDIGSGSVLLRTPEALTSEGAVKSLLLLVKKFKGELALIQEDDHGD